jgi:hypothetical protein
MKNKITFVLSIALLCSIVLACNFKFGTSENKEVAKNPTNSKKGKKSRDEDKASNEKQSADLPKKLDRFNYQRFDYSVYLIPKNLSQEELITLAGRLHDDEPKSFLVLVDDDKKAEQYVTYHEQAEKGAADVEFPQDWADEHIVASVIMFLEGERKWYLTKGYGYEKIAELE